MSAHTQNNKAITVITANANKVTGCNSTHKNNFNFYNLTMNYLRKEIYLVSYRFIITLKKVK
jgi:hypothetical protein